MFTLNSILCLLVNLCYISNISMLYLDRTPSQATLDSLDTARYSEDGGGDRGGSGGDVAVLEFELRKARETINALRANLTQFAGKLDHHHSSADHSLLLSDGTRLNVDIGTSALRDLSFSSLNYQINTTTLCKMLQNLKQLEKLFCHFVSKIV